MKRGGWACGSSFLLEQPPSVGTHSEVGGVRTRKGRVTNHLFRDAAVDLHSFCLQSIKVSFFVIYHHPFVCLEQERLDTEQMGMLRRNQGNHCQSVSQELCCNEVKTSP